MPGEKIGVGVVTSSTTCEAEVICGEKFYPTLYAWFGLADFGDLLEALVVGVDVEEYARKVASKAADASDDAAGFGFPWGPVFLIIECGAADVYDGANGTIQLFLSEGCTQAVGAGIAV